LPAGSPSFGFLVFLVAVVVVVAGVGAGLLYAYNHPKLPSSPETVAIGDNVSVNYIGVFGSGPQEGKVFDTSLQAVATDNASYPKSLEYSPRNASGYTPLTVSVGPDVPAAGYNVSGVVYGPVIPGFWQGLVGLAVNQTHWITIPPDLGYGDLVTACLVTASLNQSVPTVVTVSPTNFLGVFPGATPAAGATFVDYTYGWTDVVLSVNSSAVVVQREPYVGETTAPYGWTMVVTGLSSQAISLRSELTPADDGTILGTISNASVCSTTSFLVWDVDLAAGTFEENYNHEVVGETLLFQVTVTSILPPS
jgi:FKBP-type peptidyl-prolyl cis-trans isomerase 2